MTAAQAPSLIAAVLLLLVGALGLASDWRSAATRWFALLNLLLAATTTAGGITLSMPESHLERALFFGRGGYGTTTLAFVAFGLQLDALSRDITHPWVQRLRGLRWAVFVIMLPFGVLSTFTPLVVRTAMWSPGVGYLPLFGPLIPGLLVAGALASLWALALLVAIGRFGSPAQRREMLWIGVGVFGCDWLGLLLVAVVLPRLGLATVPWGPTVLAAGSTVMLVGMVLTRQQELDALSPRARRRARASSPGGAGESSCRACVLCGAIPGAHVEMAHCPLDGGEIVAGVDPWPGRTLEERFAVEKLLGTGGMGRVYRARHIKLGVPIALKLLNADLAADRRTVERFAREARSAMRVQSPYVVRVHDLGELAPGIPYLTMELIEGVVLADLLAGGRRLAAPSVALLGQQLALGLAAAHAEGVIHRDLKPANVLVVRDRSRDVAKIVDFGLAKIVDEERGGGDLTTVGRVFGTPAYLSPEQAEGSPATAKSDVYALGVVLYRARAGVKPFTGKPLELLARHLRDPPPPLGDHAVGEASGASQGALDGVVLRLLAKAPDARPDARALAVELAALTGGATRLEVRPPGGKERRPDDRTLPVVDDES
jgi:tRNA A-37 threonylcarbamoyl transferase component Bud32